MTDVINRRRPSDTTVDAALIELASSGDQRACARILAAKERLIRAACHSHLEWWEREDGEQEIATRLLASLAPGSAAPFRGRTDAELNAFILQVARNVGATERRAAVGRKDRVERLRSARPREGHPVDPMCEVDDRNYAAWAMERVRRAVPADQFTAFVATAGQGRSHRDVADELGVQESTIAVRTHRTRKAAAALLGAFAVLLFLLWGGLVAADHRPQRTTAVTDGAPTTTAAPVPGGGTTVRPGPDPTSQGTPSSTTPSTASTVDAGIGSGTATGASIGAGADVGAGSAGTGPAGTEAPAISTTTGSSPATPSTASASTTTAAATGRDNAAMAGRLDTVAAVCDSISAADDGAVRSVDGLDRLVIFAPLYTAPGTSGLPQLIAGPRAGSSLPQLIMGGPEAEFLQANTPDAVICGGGGDDVLRTMTNAILVGGPGADMLKGGSGNDLLLGDLDDLSLYGGGGSDSCSALAGMPGKPDSTCEPEMRF